MVETEASEPKHADVIAKRPRTELNDSPDSVTDSVPVFAQTDQTFMHSPSTSQEKPRKRQRLNGRTLSRPGVGKVFNFVIVILAVVSGGYWAAEERRAPDFLRQFGVVGNLTSSLTSVAPKSFVAVPLSVVLRHTIKLNAESQLEASRKGAFKSAFVLLGQNSSLTRQTEGLKLIQDLINGNSALKDLALSRQYDLLSVLNSRLAQDKSNKLTSGVAELLAVLAGDHSSSRKKRISSSGLVEQLHARLQGKSQSAESLVWAIANLLVDSSQIQALALKLGLPEALKDILETSENNNQQKPSVYAAGNLAVNYPAGQEALNNAGVIEALVKHIDKAVTGVKLQNSQSFRPELLEHLSEVQKSDSDVKAAISEVGGLEGLLELVETGSRLETTANLKDTQLMVLDEDTSTEDHLASVRSAVRDLQDEADVETGLIPDLQSLKSGLASLARGHSGARVLPKLDHKIWSLPGLEKLLGRSHRLAGDSAWALAMIVADNPINQNAAREAGALQGLMKLVEGTHDPGVAKSALRAISSLVKSNAENKMLVHNTNGVQGLVKLLASNPADKEVLKATAEALKSIGIEKPAYETLTRGWWRSLRVLGRRLSLALLNISGKTVSPIVCLSIFGAFTSFIVIILVSAIMSRLKGGISYE